MKIKDVDGVSKDSILWKWRKGELSFLAEMGDVETTASFALCFYDSSGMGGADELLMESRIVPGSCRGKPCWRVSSSGLKYGDKTRSPDGIAKVVYKQGLDGKSAILLKARGARTSVAPPPYSLPVTIQMHASAGVCFETLHGAASKNEGIGFASKSD